MRLNSVAAAFLLTTSILKSWIISTWILTTYPKKLIEQEMEKVEFFKNGNVVRQRDPKKVSVLFLRTTLFKSMSKIINKHRYWLYMNNKVKKVFTAQPLISFCSAKKKKISSYLVRAKLYPEERTIDSFNVVVSIVRFL